MLDNAFYAGLIEWGDEKNHQGPQPGIIDREVFDKVAKKLTTIGKGRPKTKE